MDIAQWEQQFDHALKHSFELISRLFTGMNLAPEVARSAMDRVLTNFHKRLEQHASVVAPPKALSPRPEPGPYVRDDIAATVSAIVDVGDQTWVPPLAVVEDTTTGEFYVDPRFAISDMPSDYFSVELVVTDDGLVASGPLDQHRLRDHVDRSRFRPLHVYRAATG